MPAATIPVMEAIILGAIRLTAVTDSVPKIDNKSHTLYLAASFAIRHNVFIIPNKLCHICTVSERSHGMPAGCLRDACGGLNFL
jgi:hypothetical protein